MTHHSTSITSTADMYMSEIVASDHGNKYQKNLALVLFERATRKGYDFRMAYEMATAGKFDDVAFFNNSTKEWMLIQTKHADITKGKAQLLTFEMLFPTKDKMREKAPFSIFKYLESYASVQTKIEERKRFIIFTNRDLDDGSIPSIDVEPRQMEEILSFGHACRHVGLIVKDDLVKQMVDYVNRDYISEKSKTKKTRLLVDEVITRQFFQDLVLSVGQPDDLGDIIDHDLRSWMRMWMRPDFYRRLEESQLKINTVSLEEYFNEKQKPVKTDGGKSYKNFLHLADGVEFFAKVQQDLQRHIRNFAIYRSNNASEYYINRQIWIEDQPYENKHFNESSAKILYDEEFSNELPRIFGNKRLLLLSAAPGMGKSTLLEFIAMAAQRKTQYCVDLFHLNTMNKNFNNINTTDNIENLLSVFETELSVNNFKNLQSAFRLSDSKTKHLLIFDAFDEASHENRGKIIKLFQLMLKTPSIQIIVSSRKTDENEVETTFAVKAMRLVSFNEEDRIKFLRKFWKVSDQWGSPFFKYVGNLFNFYQSGINLWKSIGIPLMLKMLAEVYVDHFKEYIKLKQNSLNENVNAEDKTWFEKFSLEHRLFAIQYLKKEELKTVLKDETYNQILIEFEKLMKNGAKTSPLVEITHDLINFLHRSYAEFLVADYLYRFSNKFGLQITHDNLGPMIRCAVS